MVRFPSCAVSFSQLFIGRLFPKFRCGCKPHLPRWGHCEARGPRRTDHANWVLVNVGEFLWNDVISPGFIQCTYEVDQVVTIEISETENRGYLTHLTKTPWICPISIVGRRRRK